MRINKFIKMKYVLLIAFSSNNVSYNIDDSALLGGSSGESQKSPTCCGNIAKLITLPLVILLPIAALIIGNIGMNGVQDMNYNATIENKYAFVPYCINSRTSAPITDVEYMFFNETLNLYSSSACISESSNGPVWVLIISILYALTSFVMDLIHKLNNKIIDLVRFVLQMLLWLAMLVFSILTITWFVSDMSEAATINVSNSQFAPLEITFTNTNAATNTPCEITTEILPNINSGLEFNLPDVRSYFPMTMSCSLMGFISSITQTIDYINNNNVSNIFDPSKAEVTKATINDTTLCNSAVITDIFQYLHSNQTNNLPTDVSSVVTDVVYVVVQGVLVILSFLLSIWSCVGDIIRYKNNIKAS